MEPDTYIIWSVKMNAWWGQTATYISDFSKAKQFTREKAIAFCKARFNGQLGDQGLNCVPVEFDVAAAISEKN